MSPEHYAAITFACVLVFWVFCMITLSLFFEDVFYEADTLKGEGCIKPKSATDVVLFMWVFAPLTLLALLIKKGFTRAKRPASA